MSVMAAMAATMSIEDISKYDKVINVIMNVEEITSKFSYEISDFFKNECLQHISEKEAIKTFQEHDDVIRLDPDDGSPLVCSKYFEDYYIFANGMVFLENKSIRIISARKIPIRFINSLDRKDFEFIISSFYEQVAENFTWKKDIKDSVDPRKTVANLAFSSFIYEQKYLDFLDKYGKPFLDVLEQFKDKIDPNIGTIEFKISHHNLFEPSNELIVLSKICVGNSEFILQRGSDMMLIFQHNNPNTGKRVSRLRLDEVGNGKQHFIVFVWGPKEVRLYMGRLIPPGSKLVTGDYEKMT